MFARVTSCASSCVTLLIDYKMKVICAGYPKTGTKSMNAALTKLGYKVYDSPENTFILEEDYIKIFKDGWTSEDFKRMYEDVDAIVDIPACHFWEEIHKAFPDAKIILTMRENEDIWYQSFKNQVEKNERNVVIRCMDFIPTRQRMLRDFVIPHVAMAFGASYKLRWRTSMKLNEAMAKLKYRAHNAYVLHNAPKDKFLVFSCKEGWEPLCKFLGVPVPDCPFPHKNVRGDILGELMKNDPSFLRLQREIKLTALVFLLSTSIGGFLLWKVGPRGINNFACDSLTMLWEKIPFRKSS